MLAALRTRLQILRQRLREPAAEPWRVWARRDWWKVSLVGLAVAGILSLDSWLLTCGFQGCPSRSEVRAYRPTITCVRSQQAPKIGHPGRRDTDGEPLDAL